jgi:hypothetical protein
MEENISKAQNFWLRLGLTVMILVYLTSLSVMNRGIISERKTLTDSLTYYKKVSDSLRNDNDSLFDENFELNRWNGIEELILDDLATTKSKYKNISEDIEKERNSNKYE